MSAAPERESPELLRVLRQVFRDSSDAVAITGPRGEHLYQNARHRRLFGLSELEHLRGAAAILERSEVERTLEQVAHGGLLHRTVTVNGRSVALSVFRVELPREDAPLIAAGEALGSCLLLWISRVAGVSEVGSDLEPDALDPELGMRHLVEELALASREYQRLLETDPISGVRNRHGLTRVLSGELGRARVEGAPLVAVLIDCDDFKRINDRLGFAVGDIVLREVARRLQDAADRAELVARVGGDQFLVVLPDTPLEAATHVAERLRLAVASSPILIADDLVEVTVSLGVVELPRTTSTLEEVLTISYRALHASKRDGKNRVSSGQFPRVRTTRASRPPLAEVGDQLLGQPGIRAFTHDIVRLSDELSVGCEMLARGPHGPFESPLHFFRASLEANILTAVDLRCLQTCIETGRASRAERIHLNVFPSTLLATPLGRLLEFFEDEPQRFVVELSEQQVLGDVHTLRPALDALRSRGVRVAIDDVGFGRSSLEALLVLEPDVVKIDRSCVSGAWQAEGRTRMLARLVRAVHALDAELIAEGIESRQDLELLRSFDIEYGQGFLWGAPVACLVG